MRAMKLTALRSQLFQVADQVLESGQPIAIERNGRTLLLTPQMPAPKLLRLSKRELIIGDAETLVDTKAHQWREPANPR